MDVKLDERLKRHGFETVEPLPGSVQPPPRRFFALSPINRRRIANFKRNRRGYWSLWIFLALFGASLLGEIIANERPIAVGYKGEVLFPVLFNFPESKFGGFLATTDYRDPYIQKEILGSGGWMLWPPIRYSDQTHNLSIPTPAPVAPWWTMSKEERCARYPLKAEDPNCTVGNWHWLGTDDQTRDVVARLIYGFRISVAFGLTLALISSAIGVLAGAVQGYFGGWVDLSFQRFLEIWGSLPSLYILLVISSVIAPSFFVLLGIMLLFSWTALVGVVRAEFLRGRNFEYITAARALGVGNATLMFRHLLPNAMVATLTFLPFILSGSVTTLTALDFLGYGMPPGSPSLGEMLNQAKDHIQAPWLGLTAFMVISIMLSLLVFIGEAVRDAFDPAEDGGVIPTVDLSGGFTAVGSPQPPPLLSVRNLGVEFRQAGAATMAVTGASFDLAKGETLALVGESGSGKSVTALSVMRLLPPSAFHPAGEIFFKGKDLLKASEKDLRAVRGNDIGIVFQEPMTSLNPLHTIERQVGEVLKVHRGMGDKATRARVLELLVQVGIREAEDRLKAYPHQLSGGQRQRVMIAMALANEPDLFIADEPTTALDVTVQAQILKLLMDLQAKSGMALLFITHDLGIVRRMAQRVCVMTGGRIVEQGPTEEIFRHPQHAYTRHLLAAEPKGMPPKADLTAPVVMTAEDLKVWFPIRRGLLRKTIGHIKAVDGVDITVREGQTLGVVGESGSGKTSLGLAVMRLISSKGRIVFLGHQIQGATFKEMRPHRSEMQIVFQDPYGSLSPRMSIADIVGEGLKIHERSLSPAQRDTRVAAALVEVGLDPETRHRYPHEFSGGQRQRIAVARAMVLQPRFVMLDEPTSALDMSVQAQVVDLLRDLQIRHNLAYLFISHDLKVVRALANDIIVMRQGKVVEAGTAETVFQNPKSDYTRALMAAAFAIEAVPEGIVAQ